MPEHYVQHTIYSEVTGRRVATVFDEHGNVPVIKAAPKMLAVLRECLDEMARLDREINTLDDETLGDIARPDASVWAKVRDVINEIDNDS